MGSVGKYEDFRSIYTPNVDFFTPQPTVPCGSAILDPENGITESSISPVFKPWSVRGLTFQNRLILAPMCMYSCKDGMLSDFHVAHYGQYALRGVSLVTIEATAVMPQVRLYLLTFPQQALLLRAILDSLTPQSGP